MSLLTGMSEMYDKSDKIGHVMTKDEMYADFMISLAIATEFVTSHTKSCDICLNWAVSGHGDLYTLKCGDGWILRTEVDQINTKADKLVGIVS